MVLHLFYISYLMFFGLGCTSAIPEGQKLKAIGTLPAMLDENSGMVYLGHGLYAGTNDSGNPAELCVFYLEKKKGVKSVKIHGASNVDWEELTTDSLYVYIGDTGNNSGNRKNLKIYRVNKADLREKTEVTAESISFHYPEQKKFDPSNRHNFDCEAMAVIRDSLYLFTKNRGNGETDMYSLPKVPGTYSARYLDHFGTGGLITGAAARTTGASYELVLVGYTFKEKGYHPFLLYFSNVEGVHFFKGSVDRFVFQGKAQTESVLFHDRESVLITNEGEHGDKGLIYQAPLRN